MMLKKWNELPDVIKCEEIKEYYNVLNNKKTSLILKRLFDIITSSLLLVIFSPLLLIISVLIKLDSKGDILYKQERITKYGRKFKIYKFRTMINNADKIGNLITIQNDSRITKLGSKIRKYRLDEIPQLINVLIGDMSFVGTRPEVEKYVLKYTNEMKATLLMPAGITSIASIKFKDEDNIIEKQINIEKTLDELYVQDILPQKMKWNLEYIKKFNFINDIKICFDTVIKVMK